MLHTPIYRCTGDRGNQRSSSARFIRYPAATTSALAASAPSAAQRIERSGLAYPPSHSWEGPAAIAPRPTSDREKFIASLPAGEGSASCSSSDFERLSATQTQDGGNKHGTENEIAKSGLCLGRRRDAGLRRPDVRADARHGAARAGAEREAGVQRRRRENPSRMPPGEAPQQAGRPARQEPRGESRASPRGESRASPRGESRAMTAYAEAASDRHVDPARSRDRRQSIVSAALPVSRREQVVQRPCGRVRGHPRILRQGPRGTGNV
jgi:hypothetical protein